MKELHEFGHYAFDRVGDEYLIAIELYTVAIDVEIILDFGEEQNAGEIERIVDVEVDPEERLVLARIEFLIELAVVLIGQFGRLLHPLWFGIVYHQVAV